LTKVLYLTRNGLLEPLGQSQVFSYLKGLSLSHSITVMSFEKPEDWADEAAMQNLKQICDQLGVRWLPYRFHSGPYLVAPVMSMLAMLFVSLREVMTKRANIIHARSYIPAGVALAANWLTKVPFIFDMRALWPEELIQSQRLTRGSFLHSTLCKLERNCISKAAAIVSLTHAAIPHLRKCYPKEMAGKTIDVIPTCADLSRYRPSAEPFAVDDSRLFGCIGTIISGWFRIDLLADFFTSVAARIPDSHFECITRDDPAKVRAAMTGSAAVANHLTIRAMKPADVHLAIQRQSAAAMFFRPGTAKLGSSPTRLGETLGCGVPVIVNEGVGDVADIVRKYRVGVVIEGESKEQMNEAVESLLTMLDDHELPTRCRTAAEQIYSLENGTNAYDAIYKRIAMDS
jgi:glycosyltransferase involved in cell wall biosynthesis